MEDNLPFPVAEDIYDSRNVDSDKDLCIQEQRWFVLSSTLPLMWDDRVNAAPGFESLVFVDLVSFAALTTPTHTHRSQSSPRAAGA